jgi:hypothetical protein
LGTLKEDSKTTDDFAIQVPKRTDEQPVFPTYLSSLLFFLLECTNLPDVTGSKLITFSCLALSWNDFEDAAALGTLRATPKLHSPEDFKDDPKAGSQRWPPHISKHLQMNDDECI